MPDFVHLHNHSHYSILDGISKVDKLAAKARTCGQAALALTDHGNMFGVMEFKNECGKYGVKPIYGAELYIAPKSRFEKDKGEKYYHIVLLAADQDGYVNLIKLTSLGYIEGFYSKPRIDRDILADHSKGLIVLSACLSGEIPRMILNGRDAALTEALDWYVQVFGKDRFFLEIQNHGLQEEFLVTKKILEISRRYGLKTVATNDSHYIERDDSKLQEIAFAVRDKRVMSDPARYRFPNDEFYYKSPDEMAALFSEIPDALSNTMAVAEACNVTIKNVDPARENHIPSMSLPEGETADTYLTRLARDGLARRFEGHPGDEYGLRLQTELDLIRKMGFSNYFLIVADIVRHAKETGILVGPGRGSAAGALLSYSLGITNIDPIRYGLLFERFLNPERVTMPDIDVDFEDDRRDEVKEYIRSKYGYDKTADIITFNILKSRASLKDVGRVLEIPLENVNRLTKFIDNKTANNDLRDLVFGKADPDPSKVIQPIPELKSFYQKAQGKDKTWFDQSMQLNGTNRSIGTHASGVVISDVNLMDIVPLYRDVQSGIISTQFEHEHLEKLGLIKMDILGISNLTMIKDCLGRIRKRHGVKIDINAIPLDDTAVYEIFSRGETNGIFQFESPGMTDYMKKLRPNRIDDLIAMNALYRPGPMDNIPAYIARKEGREPVDCFHKDLEPVLATTYGVIVYQEQVMQITQILSGFSLGKADEMRRAMGKKIIEKLVKLKPEFLNGAQSRGYESALAEKIWETLIPFANYAFNKSHSAAYAILAYQIAYLKAHYPLEFMASLLSLNMGESDKVRQYCQEASAKKIRVLPPDINRSFWEFREIRDGESEALVFGFGAIKGLGEGISRAITEEREIGGPYTCPDNFLERILKYAEFKKVSMEILVKAGCFDSLFPADRILAEKAILLKNLDITVSGALNREEEKKSGQLGLFCEDQGVSGIHVNRNVPPLTIQNEFENELALFGFYLSGKLFDHHSREFGRISSVSQSVAARLKSGTGLLLWGFVHDTTVRTAANKKPYAVFSLDNGSDHFKLFLFSEKFDQFREQIKDNHFVMVRLVATEARAGARSAQFDVTAVKPIQSISKERFTQLHICLDTEGNGTGLEESLGAVKDMAVRPENRGIIQLVFHVFSGPSCRTVQASNKYGIRYNPELMDRIAAIPHIRGFWYF